MIKYERSVIIMTTMKDIYDAAQNSGSKIAIVLDIPFPAYGILPKNDARLLVGLKDGEMYPYLSMNQEMLSSVIDKTTHPTQEGYHNTRIFTKHWSVCQLFGEVAHNIASEISHNGVSCEVKTIGAMSTPSPTKIYDAESVK